MDRARRINDLRDWVSMAGPLGEEAAQRVICEYLFTRFGIPCDTVNGSLRFQEDLGLDSLQVTEVLLSVEDETGVDLGLARLDSADDVISIGALAARVSRMDAAQREARAEREDA